MKNKLGCLLAPFLGFLCAVVGGVVAILLRPSYPDASPSDIKYSLDKPTLPTMLQRGITGTNTTDRHALIYLILGIVLGALIGAVAGFLISLILKKLFNKSKGASNEK